MLEDFSAIREHANVCKTAIPLPSKCMPSSIPDCLLLGVGGDEIAAAGIAIAGLFANVLRLRQTDQRVEKGPNSRVGAAALGPDGGNILPLHGKI